MLIAKCGNEANNAYLSIVYILLHASDMLILDRHQAAGELEAQFGVPANPTGNQSAHSDATATAATSYFAMLSTSREAIVTMV